MSGQEYRPPSVGHRSYPWLAAHFVIAVAMLLLGTPETRASAGEQAPAADRELRVTRDANGVVTTLTLVLRGPQGVLPINLVMRATQQPWPRANTPTDFAMDFLLGPAFGGTLDLRRPHYVLNIDEGSAEHDTVEGSVDERQPLFAVRQVNAPFDLVTLSRLSRARAVSGRFFGIAFGLTPEQVRAIGDFAVRALKPPQ